MHIPDKYRDRYDRLAASHPWMREMRDETETIGDLIEKRKKEIEERNHLIAKARNSFKSLAESNYDYAKFRKACRRATEIMDAEMGRMGIASDGRALEAADEPTNGIDGETNGIAEDSPLVEGDAVSIMRKAAKGFAGGTGHVMKNAKVLLGINEVSGCDSVVLETLADMVERDYVPRYMHDILYDVWNTRIESLIAERDELKKRVDEQQETLDNDCRDLIENDNEICKLKAERDDAHEQWKHWSKLATDIIALFYPVEEEGLPNDAYNVVKDSASKLTAERNEWKAKAFDYEHRLNVELACSDKSIIEALESERDEWKSKAERAERAMNAAAGKWARADAELREGSSKVRVGSSSAKRAAAVERLRQLEEHDGSDEIVKAMVPEGVTVNSANWTVELDTIIDLLTDEPMDTQRDTNGTCPDAMGQSSNHSKAQSKTEPKLSEQSESLSDAISENHEKSQNSEIDSREKLEAEIRYEYNGSIENEAEQIIGWLNRQAAIAEREVKLRELYKFEENHRGHIRSIEEVNQKLNERIAELTAKVDEQSELIAARGKTIESLEKFMSERKLKLKKQLESKNEQCRKLKAERDQYRELYEAAMSTDYAQAARERDAMSGQIDQIRSIIDEEQSD